MGEKAMKMTTTDLQKVILIDIDIAIPPFKGRLRDYRKIETMID
jgi:hypothetical protein